MASKRGGIRWKGNAGPSRYKQRINEFGSDVKTDIAQSMANYMKYGEQRTKVHVETRGTASNPNPGRIRSGDMRNAIKSRVDVNGNKIVGRFGWLEGTPKYALFQEEGTQGGQGNGKGIEAMHALLDAYIQTRDKLQSKGFL